MNRALAVTASPASLEALLETQVPALYRVALAVIRHPVEAEAVVMESLERLVASPAAPHDVEGLTAWLMATAVRAALTWAGHERAADEATLDGWLPRFEADGHRAGDRAWLEADWSGRSHEDLLTGPARAALEATLERLPPSYRAVLVLRDVERWPLAEVAAALGEPLPAVGARLHRARMILREQLTRAITPVTPRPPSPSPPAGVGRG